MLFQSKHPHYEHLRKKWGAKNKDTKEKFLDKHGDTLRRLTLGGLGGVMLLSNPTMDTVLPHPINISGSEDITKVEDKNGALIENLKLYLPSEVRKLTDSEEKNITSILSEKLGMSIKGEIEGMRLNRSYGLIGGEQHLYRFPGDNLHKHAENLQDWAMFGSAGIAPGLGAWGYFASSDGEFSEKDKARERYYIAVQTFLAPGFAENFGKYRDFFKFRKMLIINSITGKSVVTVVGDAGPSEWTGKHLGGSPEVMHELGLAGGPRKGPVLYFFIDDPEDKIPLGPVKLR